MKKEQIFKMIGMAIGIIALVILMVQPEFINPLIILLWLGLVFSIPPLKQPNLLKKEKIFKIITLFIMILAGIVQLIYMEFVNPLVILLWLAFIFTSLPFKKQN